MKRLLIYLFIFLLTGGSQALLLSCATWELPVPKTQRSCIEPASGSLQAQSNLLKVVFSINNSSGTIDKVDWDFGNGITTSTMGTQVTYTYPVSNTYTVTATLTNSCSLTTKLSQTISVTDRIVQGLIAYLPFINGSLEDASGNKNKALWLPSTTNPQFTEDFKGPNSLNDKAILFNGNTDYIVLRDNKSLQFDSTFSISLWIKPDLTVLNAITDRRMQIYNKSDSATSQKESYSSSMRYYAESGNTITFINSDIKQGNNCNSIPGTGWVTLSAKNNTTFLETGWHHIVSSFDRGNAFWYIDGVLFDFLVTPVKKIDNCPGGDLRFGVQNFGSIDQTTGKPYANYFQGAMDDIRIYNRALTLDDVKALYALKK